MAVPGQANYPQSPAADNIHQANITLTFKAPVNFDTISLQEYIHLRQRIEQYYIEAMIYGNGKKLPKVKAWS